MPLAVGEVNYEGLAVGASTGWSQVAAADRAVVVDTPRSRGTRAARVMVKAGDSVAGGCRAEGTKSFPAVEAVGTDGWYAYNVYLPDGTNPFGRTDPKWESGGQWGILFQLHHPQSTGSPPFALGADRGWSTSQPHTLYLDVRGGGSYADAIGTNGKTRNVLTLHNPLPLGKWIRVVMNIGWRSDATGWVKCWTKVDGVDTDFVLRADKAGIKTTYTDIASGTPYWKRGIYCSASDTSIPTRVLYEQGFRRAADYADAAAWCLGTGGGGSTPDPTPPPAATIPLPPDSNRFGTVTGGAVMAAGTPDRIRGTVYNLPVTSSIPALKAYLDGGGPATSGSGQVKGVIYNAAGLKVAETQVVTVAQGAPGDWVALPFATAPTIPAGDYRLALITGGADVVRYASGTETDAALELAIVTWPASPVTWSGSPDTGKRVAMYGVTATPSGAAGRAVIGSGVRLTARATVGAATGAVVASADVVLRTPDVAWRPDIAAALALLDGAGFVCSIRARPYQASTGRPLMLRPDGKYVLADT